MQPSMWCSMLDWLARREQRRRDLTSGADADLVHENRRRFRFSLCQVGAAFLLSWSRKVLHMEGWLSEVILCVAIAGLIGGFIGMKWAREESKFLGPSDPEEPPRVFKLYQAKVESDFVRRIA